MNCELFNLLELEILSKYTLKHGFRHYYKHHHLIHQRQVPNIKYLNPHVKCQQLFSTATATPTSQTTSNFQSTLHIIPPTCNQHPKQHPNLYQQHQMHQVISSNPFQDSDSDTDLVQSLPPHQLLYRMHIHLGQSTLSTPYIQNYIQQLLNYIPQIHHIHPDQLEDSFEWFSSILRSLSRLKALSRLNFDSNCFIAKYPVFFSLKT